MRINLILFFLLIQACAAIELVNGPPSTSYDLQEKSLNGSESKVWLVPTETVHTTLDLDRLCPAGQTWSYLHMRSSPIRSLLPMVWHNPQNLSYSCQGKRK